MKNRSHIEENHRDMPEDVLQVLYSRCDTAELQTIMKKFEQSKAPDLYTLNCKRMVEQELLRRGVACE